ncbi:MAG: hypothetical protein AAB869_02460 [Patescibacteria group bacterium]
MGDDLVTGGILPDGVIAGDDEDPNTVESDDFLDDPEEVIVLEVADIPLAAIADDDDDDLLEDE